jgi:FixJ family two-component response regulator
MELNRANYRIRILDDDSSLLQALAFTLSILGWEVNLYSSAAEFFEKEDFTAPGCLILDYEMPQMNGIEVQSRLAKAKARLPIIFLTAHAEIDLAIESFRQGAVDFLRKPADASELNEAIQKSLKIQEEKDLLERISAPEFLYEELTEREKYIAGLIAKDLSSAIIAERTGNSPRTIERHRSNIFRKLKLHSSAELAEFLQSQKKQKSG